MMNKMQISETSRAPAKRVRFHFIHGVPPRRWPEAATHFPATSTVDFCCASDVEYWSSLELLDPINNIADRPASNTELRVFGEVAKAPFKVVGIERQVSIKLNDELPIVTPQTVVPIVERFYHAASRLSKSAVLAMHAAYPTITRSVVINDPPRAVAGAVINDYPLGRKNRLTKHAFESITEVRFLVPGGSDYYI